MVDVLRHRRLRIEATVPQIAGCGRSAATRGTARLRRRRGRVQFPLPRKLRVDLQWRER
jgi:hypothetical protein